MTCAPCVIVVPVYNEAASLPTFLSQVEASATSDCQFLLVDNGSSDPRCSRLLEPGGRHWSSLRVEPNRGFGGAIIAGVRAATAPRVGWMPANLKVHPREAVRMAGLTDSAASTLLKGARRGRSLAAHAKTALAGVAQSLAARTLLLDSGGTPTIGPRSLLLALPHPPTDFTFESYVLFVARKLGMPVRRLRVTYGERVHGTSHWQHGLGSEIRLLREILRQLPAWSADVREMRRTVHV